MASLAEARTLALLERIGGCLSLVGALFVLVAYALVPKVRNPRNTFILFMQSDAWWSLGMSFHTFLVVYGRTDPNSLRMWPYGLVCFGGPFISGVSLFFVSNAERGPAYGATNVWCWIRDDWANIRLFTSYLFVWTCVIGSLILNSVVGARIFSTRNRIRNFSSTPSQHSAVRPQVSYPNTPDLHRHPSPYATIVTQVTITRAPASLVTEPTPVHSPTKPHPNRSSSQEEITHSSIITSQNVSHQTPRIIKAAKRAITKFHLQDPVKRAYLRTTFLFTLSVLVSWTPASINRIRSLQHGSVPFSYQVAMVSVMPLQGVWNGVIFYITSRKTLKEWAWEKWGFSALEPEVTAGQARARAVEEANVHHHHDLADSGSDVELNYVVRVPVKKFT